MGQLGSRAEDIAQAGLTAAYIAAEKGERRWKNPRDFLAAHPVPFPYLLDEDRAVTKAYGVYHAIGLDAFNIARPASFLVDRGGVVRLIYVGSRQDDRLPLEAILEVARRL